MDAIEPLYQEQSLDLVILDTGYMCEKVLQQSKSWDIDFSLCPSNEIESIDTILSLQSGHQVIALMAGRATNK